MASLHRSENANNVEGRPAGRAQGADDFRGRVAAQRTLEEIEEHRAQAGRSGAVVLPLVYGDEAETEEGRKCLLGESEALTEGLDSASVHGKQYKALYTECKPPML
jgi:hypothetical protein